MATVRRADAPLSPAHPSKALRPSNAGPHQPLRILLIANYAPDGQASMRAFANVLARELPQHGCEVRVLAPSQRLQRVAQGSRLWKALGYLDKFVLFIPSILRNARWADVVHICDHSNSMYVRWVSSKPHLVTCHDVIAIQAAKGMVEGWEVGWSGRLFQRLIATGIGQADRVACVSALTRRALLELRLAKPQRVTVVLNGLNDAFAPVVETIADRVLDAWGLGDNAGYLLHVGSDLPRKNRQVVVRAFIALQQRAAMAGAKALAARLVLVGPELVPELVALLQAHGLEDQVVTLQDVAHEGLCALYSRAVALVFPSLQEGFGWPVIEAQACGCPVFVSDLAPMNEIAGAGAVYVDPSDPLAIAVALEQAAFRLPQMRRLGVENALHYSTECMTANYVATYRQVLAQVDLR